MALVRDRTTLSLMGSSFCVVMGHQGVPYGNQLLDMVLHPGQPYDTRLWLFVRQCSTMFSLSGSQLGKQKGMSQHRGTLGQWFHL